MEARQRAQLTGTNRSFDLIALVAKARARESARGRRMTDDGSSRRPSCPSSSQRQQTSFASIGRQMSSDLRPLPAWWLLQGDQTRSHPELGRQTPSRQWYSVSRHGRVGRRQACKARRSDNTRQTIETRGSAQAADRRRLVPNAQRFLFNDMKTERPGQPCRPASSVICPPIAAGWSSPVARQAHNLKAAGSNPAPATKLRSKNKALGFHLAPFLFPNDLTHS